MSPKAKARQAPREPGVYLMRDSAGTIIYVGKDKDLRARLASYFRPGARPTPGAGVVGPEQGTLTADP